jgi:hypothetical protein
MLVAETKKLVESLASYPFSLIKRNLMSENHSFCVSDFCFSGFIIKCYLHLKPEKACKSKIVKNHKHEV